MTTFLTDTENGYSTGRPMGLVARATDPADPPEGRSVVWMRANGDIMSKATISGATATAKLADYDTPGGEISAAAIDGSPIGATTPASGAFTTLSATGLLTLSVAAVAAAGSGQSTFTAITKTLNPVTAADGTKGVALPTAAAGQPILIINTNQSNTLKVAPVNAGNDQINALTASTGVFTMGPGRAAWFIPTSATQWYVSGDAAIVGTPTEQDLDGITATVAELNMLDNAVASVSWAVTAGATNVCVLTGTLKDAAGATIAASRPLFVYISEASTGIGITADAYSTGASVTTGTQLVALTANKAWLINTHTDGTFAISITDTGVPADQYAVALSTTTGALSVSAASAALWGA